MKKRNNRNRITNMEKEILKKILILHFMMMLVFFSSAAAKPASWNVTVTRDTVEEKIWALEESYFVSLYEAKYAEVVALYDTHFLGWPNGLKQPIGVEESTRFMKQLIPKPTSCTIRIEQAGISVVGTTALTQYTLHVDCLDTSGGTKTTSSRITHTWIKRETGWKLFGGMSIDE